MRTEHLCVNHDVFNIRQQNTHTHRSQLNNVNYFSCIRSFYVHSLYSKQLGCAINIDTHYVRTDRVDGCWSIGSQVNDSYVIFL